MPDSNTDFLRMLDSVQSAGLDDSPFSALVKGSQDANEYLVKNAPKARIGEALIGGILTGAMGGLAQRGQKSFMNGQEEAIQGALDNWRQGKTFERGNMSRSVFNRLKDVTAAQGLAEAQRNTQENSDLERAQKLKLAPGYDDTLMQGPEAQGAMEALLNKKELTPEQAAVVSKLPLSALRAFQGQQQLNNVGDRFEQNLSFKKGERELPGFTNVTGATPPISAINEARTKIQSNEEVKTALRALKESGDVEGFYKLAGENAQVQAALSSSVFNAYRKRTGSGARLEGPEGAMLQSMTPQVLAGNFMGALKAGLLGRDQGKFAEMMMNFLDEDRDIALFSQGFKNNSRDLKFYPKDIKQRFGLDALEAEESPAKNSMDFSKAPPNMSPEQFREWKASQK